MVLTARLKMAVTLFLLAAAFSACGGEGSTARQPQLEHLWAGVNNGDIFDEPEEVQDQMLEEMAAADLRVLRVLIDFRLEMDADGHPLSVGFYDDCILEQIDELMVKAKEKGILLYITFIDANWVWGTPYGVSEWSHGWRNCQTPENVYNDASSRGEEIQVRSPYYHRLREWGEDSFLTGEAAKLAYKFRVWHILEHVNPDFEKAWKDINEVVLAWELINEPGNLWRPLPVIRDWLDEMATFVKTIDSDTYIATGTMDPGAMGNIADVDIYTIHEYTSVATLENRIEDFQANIGIPYEKLLLVAEFNPGAQVSHTPGDLTKEEGFEAIMAKSREYGVPWIFWEYGYNYDADDIWYANGTSRDGVFWGAKVIPDAMKMWRTTWDASLVGKSWGVEDKVDALCSQAGADCNLGGEFYLLDTFGGDYLASGYEWFDEEATDANSLTNRYLRIEANPSQDLWGGAPPKSGAPILFYPAPEGNYLAKTFVGADPVPVPSESQPLNTQMGMFVYQDTDHWLFFGLTNHEFTSDGTTVQRDGLIVTKTESGSSSIVAEQGLYPYDYVFLKIIKNGDDWECWWRLEYNESWTLLTTVNLPLGDHQIGLGVKTLDVDTGSRNPGQANFDYFLIEEML